VADTRAAARAKLAALYDEADERAVARKIQAYYDLMRSVRHLPDADREGDDQRVEAANAAIEALAEWMQATGIRRPANA
jgi:hypothetical protein